jgi:hypothetical protein
VHEPFHVPEPYASMYGDSADRDRFTLWPPYQNADQQAKFMSSTTAEELDFIRSQYAGKLTMVDRHFGELLKTFNELSLWEDTVVIVTTDHGHDLGERGLFGKSYPHYDGHANIPLLIRHPAYPGEGRGVSGLSTTVDLFATVLEVAGCDPPDGIHSRSLVPLLSRAGAPGREAVLYGTFGQGVCCTDGEWTVFKSPERGGSLYYYSSMILPKVAGRVRTPAGHGRFIPGVDIPQWQVPVEATQPGTHDFLFHRAGDPGQHDNLWDDELIQRKRCLGLIREIMAREGTPFEQYARLGL